MTREKEERIKGEASEWGGGGGDRGGDRGRNIRDEEERTGGWESVWVKMHPQHICKSLAAGHGGGCCRGE